MHKLPPELHHYICESACIEDAASVHALNMVSTYFHEVSKPYLYRTVAASGVQQVLALSERLAIIPPHLSRIHHLFLCDLPSQTKSNAHSASTHTEDSYKLLRCVVQILAHASPTLQTLSLFSQSPISTALIAKVFRTSFPVLRRLSIHGFYPFLSSPNRFPQLEYLHLNGNRNPSGLLQMWTLDDACPALETLRITGLSLAGSFVSEVEDALNQSGADEDALDSADDLSSPRLPAQLKSLIVQAGPLPDHGLGKVVSLKDKVMMNRLESLRSSRKGGLSVRVSVPERTLQSLSVEDMKEEWFAGVVVYRS